MLTERTMVKIRWLALGSTLAFFAILNVSQMRGLLLLIAVGVMYNLLLSSAKHPDYPETLKVLSTIVDLTGLTLLIIFTGGPDSVFVMFMAGYLFALTLRHNIVTGLVLAVLTSAGLSVYYFNNPTAATQSAVLTRIVVFIISPFAAMLIERKQEEPAVSTEAAEVHEAVKVQEAPAKARVDAPSVEVKVEKAVEEPVIERAVEPEPRIVVEPPVKPSVEEQPVSVAASEPETDVAQAEAETAVAPAVEPVTRSSEDHRAETPAAGTLAEEIEAVPEPAPSEPFVQSTVLDARVLREKISELSTLHEASKALGASLILEEIVDTVVDISAKGLQADIAGALVFDDKTGLMTVAGLRGFTSEEREVINSTTFTPGEGVLGEVYLKKKTLNIIDLSEERPGSTPFNGRVKSFLVTPLSTDGFDIGVLFLGKFIREPFSASSEEFIETISGQAAIAVENARLYTQAQELAIHNGLTGIYNYRYFMKQLDEEIKRAERYGRSVSLMMIDIDLFKNVNDSHGHQRGDEVLKGLAQTLVNNTRETDVVARYGGEEFCVILPETDLADALDVAEKLRASVAKASYARQKGHSIKITISIGVAEYPGNAGNQEDLLRKSDDALYSAKTKRNMVVSAGSEAHRLQ